MGPQYNGSPHQHEHDVAPLIELAGRSSGEGVAAQARNAITVFDSVPSNAHGLVELLRGHGRPAGAGPQPLTRWQPPERAVAVVVLRRDDDQRHAAPGTRRAAATVVALLVQPSAEDYVHVMRLGVHGVGAWDLDGDALARIIDAAIHGAIVFPRLVVAELMAQHRPPPPPWLDDDARALLRALAAEATQEQIAARTHQSQSTVSRAISQLLARMGATSATQAVVQADRWGILDPAS